VARPPDVVDIGHSNKREIMNDATPNRKGSEINEDWMIGLLEDDRPARRESINEVRPGISWMYRAALIRSN
jgi:hypothetical protein